MVSDTPRREGQSPKIEGHCPSNRRHSARVLQGSRNRCAAPKPAHCCEGQAYFEDRGEEDQGSRWCCSSYGLG